MRRIIYPSLPLAALFWRFVEDGFSFWIPIDSLICPIGMRGHHAGHGVMKSVMHGRIWLFAAAQAVEPVGHVRGFFISHPHRREARVARQQEVLQARFESTVRSSS